MAKKKDKPIEPSLAPALYDKSFAQLLKDGSKGAFWAAVKRVVQDNVDWMTEVILNKEEMDGANLNETIQITRRDFLRKWRQYNENFLNIPERIAESIELKNIENPIEFDPYARAKEDIHSVGKKDML